MPGLVGATAVHQSLALPSAKRVEEECSKPRAKSSRQPPAAPMWPSIFPPRAASTFGRFWQSSGAGKATIFWTIVASLLIAFLLVLIVPHRYTAVTQILIDPTDLRAIGNELAPANQANDANVLQVESQVRVLTSDSVLRRVVKTEGLDKDQEFTRQGIADGADSTTAALIALKRSIAVKRAERTYVVDVTVTTREAAKSASIANAIADAYLQEQTDVRSDAAGRSRSR